MITLGSTANSDCIISEPLNDSHLILDDENTTYQRLDIEVGVASIKLEVKPSCVNTVEVSIQSVTLKYHVVTSNRSGMHLPTTRTIAYNS